MNNFNKCVNKGHEAEALLKQNFEQKGYRVIDVSGVPEYQQKDIDFIITDKNGVSASFEVKGDIRAKNTGNIFLELGKYRETGYYKSWFYKSEMQYLAIVDTETKIIEIYDFQKIKAAEQANCEEWEKRFLKKNIWDSDDRCKTAAYLLPKSSEYAKAAFIKQYRLEEEKENVK